MVPAQYVSAGKPQYQHHLETYGPHTGFGYKDFIPQFKASVMTLRHGPSSSRRRARHVVPVAEHHDGFAMYDTAFRVVRGKMGPRHLS